MGKKIAILIGCNEYDDSDFPQLQYSVRDVTILGNILMDKDIGDFTKKNEYIYGESNHEILEKLEQIITIDLETSDFVLIYFSGHGLPDRLGDLHLCVKNTQKSLLGSTSLPINSVINYLKKSPCTSVVIILDCCYSGALQIDSSKLQGLHVISSSSDTQLSDENVFTRFFVRGLQNGYADINNDGIITVHEAYIYASNLIKEQGINQEPREYNYAVKSDIPLAKNICSMPIDLYQFPQEQQQIVHEGKTMIKMLERQTPSKFHIGLTQYYIENEKHKSTGLSFSPSRTQNVRITPKGFEWDAIIPSNKLSSYAKEGKEGLKGRIGNEIGTVFNVRMSARFEDISSIVGGVGDSKSNQISFFRGKTKL